MVFRSRSRASGRDPLALALRSRGDSVELVLATFANCTAMQTCGSVRIYLVGPDERSRGVAKVRDLATGEEHDEPLPGASA